MDEGGRVLCRPHQGEFAIGRDEGDGTVEAEAAKLDTLVEANVIELQRVTPAPAKLDNKVVPTTARLADLRAASAATWRCESRNSLSLKPKIHSGAPLSITLSCTCPLTSALRTVSAIQRKNYSKCIAQESRSRQTFARNQQ